ncbi:hypothetical protein [Psychrobacillus sp. OK032]|uniref:hypothetical protein n=1 Tax=Psychrobacillus sp. OK032 TaxID=1884358 RepID=UPI0011601F8E|nr:hypothetical protein [Psychrobacillus sp. OK032]
MEQSIFVFILNPAFTRDRLANCTPIGEIVTRLLSIEVLLLHSTIYHTVGKIANQPGPFKFPVLNSPTRTGAVGLVIL